MSRRIEAPQAKLGKTEGGDDFPGRLAKYIPAEIVALYVTLKGFPPETSSQRMSALWIIFWLCLALTPVYLIVTTRDKKSGKGPLWLQVLLATIAFPIWVLALGNGPLDSFGIETWITSMILAVITFVFGLIKPPPE